MSLEFKEAYEIIKEYANYNFTSLYYKKIFDLYDIITKQKLLRISAEMAISYFEKSIEYSRCMSNDELNYIELTALLYIAQIVKDDKKKQSIMLKLFDIIKSNNISDFNEKDSKIIMIYSAFSKLLGTQKEYDKVIYITKKGINLCKQNKTTYSLAHLYYYCALAYKGQGKQKEALIYARKTFFTLELEDAKLRYDAFIKLFESHFNLSFSKFKTW